MAQGPQEGRPLNRHTHCKPLFRHPAPTRPGRRLKRGKPGDSRVLERVSTSVVRRVAQKGPLQNHLERTSSG
jgi:hypothetical protein